MRCYANRIARTELHRAYTDRQTQELMSQDRIQYVQIRLSAKHPKPDICDCHANVDAYGLDPGVYPKADAPEPPFHPPCYYVVSPISALLNPQPRFNLAAGRTFLQILPVKESVQVAGQHREKTANSGGSRESMETIYNEGKAPLYREKTANSGGTKESMETIYNEGKAPLFSGDDWGISGRMRGWTKQSPLPMWRQCRSIEREKR